MDGDDLFRAVLNAPDEETPRLRYADWLAANGQSDRAELIRVQLRMAQLEAVLPPDIEDDPRAAEWDRLSQRVHELMNAHPNWRSELPEFPGVQWGAGQFWGFSGGFVSSVVVKDGATFAAQMGRVFAVAPVTSVKIDYPDDVTVQAVVGSPYLSRLTGLRLSSGSCGDAGALALAASPHAAGLRFLSLFLCRVGSAGAMALAASPHLRLDLTLQMTGNPLGPEGSRALRERFGKGLEL